MLENEAEMTATCGYGFYTLCYTTGSVATT